MSNEQFTVVLDNQGESLMASVSGPGAVAWARNDQNIGGSNWEATDDLAYAMPSDHPGLVAELEAEGYDLNLDNYSAE